MDEATAPAAATSGFPQSPSEFDEDPRISFSKLDGKYILETEDGEEYSYDPALKRWVPSVGFFASTPAFFWNSLLP